MIKLLVKAGFCLAIAGGAYVSAPFRAAWSIREAVTQADTATLSVRVDWLSVRETMRQSMLHTALDIPAPALIPAGVAAPPTPVAQGMWARFKTRLAHLAGRRMVDKLVETHITPQGLPKLYAHRRQQMQLTGGENAIDPPGQWTRFTQVWSRIKRAEFHSLTTFAIEIEDQFDSSQRYAAVLELRAGRWIMTQLRVLAISVKVPIAELR